MPASVPYDRVRFAVSGTPGSGAVTVGAAVTDATNGDCLTPAQAGVPDGTILTVCWTDGHNFEIGQSTYTVSGTSLSRDAAAKNWNGTTFATGNLSLTSGAIGFVVDASAELSPVLGLNQEYSTSVPAAPSSGVRLFAADRPIPRLGMIGAQGPAKLPGLDWGTESVYYAFPSESNLTGLTLLGFGSGNVTGTATGIALAHTNLFTSHKRVKYTTSALANSSARVSFDDTAFKRGNASGAGGFDVTLRGGIETYTAGMRFFMAMGVYSAIGTTEPSAFLNSIGLGKDAADTTMSLIRNDGTSTGTKISLGANFPANTGGVDLYELRVWCAPNAATIYYSVYRLNTGHLAQGSVTSTDMPGNTAIMTPFFAAGTAAATSAVEVAFAGFLGFGGAAI